MGLKITLVLFIILVALVVYYLYRANQAQVLSPSVEDCNKRNGKYEIITNPDGSQTGKCTLSDGSICTDDVYYKQGCYEDQIFEVG